LKALDFAERPRDDYAIFKTLGFLIRIASEKLNNEIAEVHIRQSEAILKELDSALGTLNAEYFYNAGTIGTYRGDFEGAKENYLMALRKSKEENESDLLAKCLLALATNCYNLKNYDKSTEYIHQLTQLLKIIKKDYLNGALSMLTAKVLLEKEEYDAALTFFRSANINLQTKKCWNLHGYNLYWMGMVYKSKGEFDRALSLFQLAQDTIDKNIFRRLAQLIAAEISDVNDTNVDVYLDRTNCIIRERHLGVIDFKHRFVLLEILFLLARNPGVAYDKEILAKSIWKDEYNPLIHDKLIYTSVSRLRKLIEPKLSKKDKRKYIIRGKDGYTFNPLVKTRFHLDSKHDVSPSIANVEMSSPV